MFVFFVFQAKVEKLNLSTISDSAMTVKILKNFIEKKFGISKFDQVLLRQDGRVPTSPEYLTESDAPHESTALPIFCLNHVSLNHPWEDKYGQFLRENSTCETFLRLVDRTENVAALLSQSWLAISKSATESNKLIGKQIGEMRGTVDKFRWTFDKLLDSVDKLPLSLSLAAEMPILTPLVRLANSTLESPGLTEHSTLLDLIMCSQFPDTSSVVEYAQSLIQSAAKLAPERLEAADKLQREEADVYRDWGFMEVDKLSETLRNMGEVVSRVREDLGLWNLRDILVDQPCLRRNFAKMGELVDYLRSSVQLGASRLLRLQASMSGSMDTLRVEFAQMRDSLERMALVVQIVEAPHLYVAALRETLRRSRRKGVVTSVGAAEGEEDRRAFIEGRLGDHFMRGLFVYLADTRFCGLELSTQGDDVVPELDPEEFLQIERTYHRLFPQQEESPEGKSSTWDDISKSIARMAIGSTLESTEGSIETAEESDSSQALAEENLEDVDESETDSEGDGSRDVMKVCYSEISVGDKIVVNFGIRRFWVLAASSASFVIHHSSQARIKERAKTELPNVPFYSVLCDVERRISVMAKNSSEFYKEGDVLVMLYVNPVKMLRTPSYMVN